MTVGYLCAILIAVVFMLYMDGQIGVMMLSFLLLMPVISGVMTWLVKRSLQIELILPDTAAKQRDVSAVIRLKKNTPLPLPFLRLQLHADAHFLPVNPQANPLPDKPIEGAGSFMRYRSAMKKWKYLRRTQLTPDTLPVCLSMGISRTAEYQFRLKTQFCGCGAVTLDEIRLGDYLAMFRFRVPHHIKRERNPSGVREKTDLDDRGGCLLSGIFSVGTGAVISDFEIIAGAVIEHGGGVRFESGEHFHVELPLKNQGTHGQKIQRLINLGLFKFRFIQEPFGQGEGSMLGSVIDDTGINQPGKYGV